MSTGDRPPDRTGAVRVAARLARREPVSYGIAWTAWITFYTLPLGAGLLLRAVLDRVPAASGDGVWLVLGALAGLELGRWFLFAVTVVQWHGGWVFWQTLPRLNLLRSLLRAPGPVAGRLPGSPGEAVSRFRDDAQHLALVLDVWLDVTGTAVAACSAVAVMVGVDARITVVVALPVVVALWLCRWLGHRLRVWRRREREATAAVTGFIGDAFGAVGTVKLGGAQDAVTERFRALGDERAHAARIDQVATQVLGTVSTAVGHLGTGLVLLLLVPALARGDASVGDVGLFTSAVMVMAGLPRWAARYGAHTRQAEVSIDRLAELLPDRSVPGITAPTPIDLRRGPAPRAPVRPAPPPAGAPERLRRLEVHGLSVDHGRTGGRAGASGGGLRDVHLVVDRGTVTAVTGPVGAGKSTLLRAVLGLVGRAAGEIRWNGELVDDPSGVLVPPRVSYVAQAPRLFSEALSDAVLLGVDGSGLDEAMRLACLDDDLAHMPEGLATVVGARGVRLSGGQVQRTAAARALVRVPELLVVDDLSSALDVETEIRLWAQLLDDRRDAPAGDDLGDDQADGERAAGDPAGHRRPAALLVVSHRPVVLERADRVVVLDRGRVVS